MSKRGKYSKEARERREQKRRQHIQMLSQLERAHSIVLRYSWRDINNKESVFTNQTMYTTDEGVEVSYKDFLHIKFKEQFGEGYNVSPLNHDFGEVLNRFKLSAPPTYNYVIGRGALQ